LGDQDLVQRLGEEKCARMEKIQSLCNIVIRR